MTAAAPPSLLIVEDDDAVRETMCAYLRANGFTVAAARDGTEMRAALRDGRFALILLDRNLPDSDGLELLKGLRDRDNVGIIIVSERGTPEDRAEGLEIGADDYIAKPVFPRELLARVRIALDRRAPAAASAPSSRGIVLCSFGNWVFDGVNRQLLTADGHDARLTPAEFDLLAYFIEHPGQLIERKALADIVSGGRKHGDASRSVDILVSRLRGKLDDGVSDTRYIETCRGHGYRFTPDVQYPEA